MTPQATGSPSGGEAGATGSPPAPAGATGEDSRDQAPGTSGGEESTSGGSEESAGQASSGDAEVTGSDDSPGLDTAAPEEPAESAGGASGETPGGSRNYYADPRGEVFAGFQRGFDRDHPFGSLDAFCLPHGEPAEPRRATDAGIEADAITLVHMRTIIEEIVNLGFAAPVGDPTDMFDTFTGIVNERCGGVWGRRIDLRLVEVSALGSGGTDVDTLRNAACIKATEDHQGVILLNTTSFQGTANLCVAEEHDAALVGFQALPEEYIRRGGGRLITTATTLEENLRRLVSYLVSTGALEGRRAAVIASNTPGEAEATESSLVGPLQAAGVDVRFFDVLDCGGTAICTGGISESVQRLIEERVDVVFPTLNAVSLPSYVNEMVKQGFRPGDVRFYNSDFNSQGNEVVPGLIVTFGGAEAGALYDGTVLLVGADVARFRDPDYMIVPFEDMCMREYRENSPLGEDYDPRNPEETNKHGMVTLVCSVYRVALRALYDAGPNPTRAEIFAALENLGPVDMQGMLPGSTEPGKWTIGDSLQPVTFHYPCPLETSPSGPGNCLLPRGYEEMVLLNR